MAHAVGELRHLTRLDPHLSKQPPRSRWTRCCSVLIIGMLSMGVVLAADPVQPAVPDEQQFADGSHIVLSSLTPVQVDNLATLGKVWGFLKYHHPVITSGQRNWDYALLRVMPSVLAARDRAAAKRVLHQWIAGLGRLADCKPCTMLHAKDLALRPALEWIDDKKTLGNDLSGDLQRIYRNRSTAQHYVRLEQSAGHPAFDREAVYQDLAFPDAGFQLLALFRFWNIVEYWAPYRDQIGEHWDDVLKQSIPRLALANDSSSYQLELMAVLARVRDTHVNLWNSLAVRPPVGDCNLPVKLRFVDRQAVVSGYPDEAQGQASGFKPGDVIEALDGVPTAQLIQRWKPYYAVSNEPTLLRDIGNSMGRGACGETRVQLRRDNAQQQLLTHRVYVAPFLKFHDLPGEAFQQLHDDIAYLKLSSAKKADIPRYFAAAMARKGLIIDIRNYPAEFFPKELAQHLVDQVVEFARFTKGDLSNPGAFAWTPSTSLRPRAPHYPGKVVVLIDDASQSRSEYTAMALRAAPRVKIIGSTTAGADGNVSLVPLPGKLNAWISGIGVFYPDKRPTQRIGIIPDIEVKPTLAGIRAGRDEVLEAAVAEIRSN
jgi:hypothetical protein